MQEKIKETAQALAKLGIKSYYVGGCVRDELMQIDTDDYDICLVNVSNPSKVEEILSQHFTHVTPLVGQAFPVWKTREGDQWIDWAMARVETLVGDTRKDFAVVTDGVTLHQDLHRRDFTINAIAKEVIDGEYHDPFNGIMHIAHGVLTPTSEAFCEDTLRVYRAARFLSRFPQMKPSISLIDMCKGLIPTDISPERVGMELRKMLDTAVKPSRFFDFLREVHWLQYHFTELYDVIAVPQAPKYHPEGDVYTHTMISIDKTTDPFIRVCMLCHDLGKAITTTIDGVNINDLRIGDTYPIDGVKSIGHEIAGVMPTRNMLTRIHFADHRTIRQIETMVELHMIRTSVSEKVIRRTLRRLIEKHLTYDQLVEVCRCDVSSRPPLAEFTPDIGQHRAKQLLEEDAMTPVVTGELLMSVGYTPGKEMGHIIKKALEWQDRGTLNKHNWLKMIKQYKPEKEET